MQYLAPIVKNHQYNFLPLGLNQLVGAQARPNEITYGEGMDAAGLHRATGPRAGDPAAAGVSRGPAAAGGEHPR